MARRPAAALTTALAALDRGDDHAALTALAEAWANRRSPALAELVELIDARQAERPFAEVIATKADTTRKRLAAADPDDPRLASLLLDFLEHPKFLTDRALWDLVLDRIEQAADPRFLAIVEAAAATLHGRLSPAATRDHVVRRVRALSTKLAQPKPPSAADAALEAAIAQRLGGARAKRDAEDEILREIYNDPLADAPRLVYADLLTERGDPRGELITLQFARRAGGLDESQKARERWLLKRHMKEWLGGLAPAISNTQSYSATTFERGFVAIADIYMSAEKQLPLTWREPGWATVEELRGQYQWLVLQHAPLKGLRRLGDLNTETLAIVAKHPEKFANVESLEIWIPQGLDDRARAMLACDALPGLRTLTVQLGSYDQGDIAWLVASPVARRLERLVVLTNPSQQLQTDRGRHAGVIAALATVRGHVPSVGLVPPWRAWPRPAPSELVRTDTGYRPA